jgi:hypothetical protein
MIGDARERDHRLAFELVATTAVLVIFEKLAGVGDSSVRCSTGDPGLFR